MKERRGAGVSLSQLDHTYLRDTDLATELRGTKHDVGVWNVTQLARGFGVSVANQGWMLMAQIIAWPCCGGAISLTPDVRASAVESRHPQAIEGSLIKQASSSGSKEFVWWRLALCIPTGKQTIVAALGQPVDQPINISSEFMIFECFVTDAT